MQIEVLGNSLVKIAGEIDLSSRDALYETFEMLLKKSTELTIDITELKYLDSVGIGALLWLAEKFNEKKREIKLIVLESPISKLLDLVGIRQVKNIKILVRDLKC